jgi:hypothetical protein
MVSRSVFGSFFEQSTPDSSGFLRRIVSGSGTKYRSFLPTGITLLNFSSRNSLFATSIVKGNEESSGSKLESHPGAGHCRIKPSEYPCTQEKEAMLGIFALDFPATCNVGHGDLLSSPKSKVLSQIS